MRENQSTFYKIIKTHSELSPNRVALAFGDKKISYVQFFNLCCRIAHQLQPFLKNSTFVPIIMERSHFIPLTIHGLQFINRAYVPLDCESPDERLRYLLLDIDSPIVIGQAKFKNRIEALGTFKFLCVEDLLNTNINTTLPGFPDSSPKAPSYMIYTSGTTGNPKGVINIHEGLMNRIQWMRDHYKLDSSSQFILKTPYTFDVSVWELTLPFLVGATLVVGGPKMHLKINELIRTIEKHKITDIHFVPSVLHVFLSILDGRVLQSLKRVYCSGEGLSTELTKKFFETFTSTELHNLYGPTECSIDVSYWPCAADDYIKYKVTPIGKPISNTYFYVVNEALQPLVQGQKGELLIGGIGVAQGYYKMPTLTQEKFIADPINAKLGKVYRSGDLVLQNENGQFEFFGRIDFQVKINGQRVELAEIENTLMKIDSLNRVAVLYENNVLLAFLEENGPVDYETISKFLKRQLPSYMVPTQYISVKEWPLNSSGKTDRRILKKLIRMEN
jgi:amino acid adenylation domain-containing protein